MPELDVTPWVERLVNLLKKQKAIRSAEVEAAFRRVPRHRFVETFYWYDQEAERQVIVEHDPDRPRPEHLDIIYSDAVLVTRSVPATHPALGEGKVATSSTSQPALMADMLQQLHLAPGLKVLEIGTGTGYNAALIAALVGDGGRVVTVDIQEDVVMQTRRLLAAAGYGSVVVLARDGFLGAPEEKPFDRIVATIGCTDLSPHWVEQLHPDGFMLIPLLHGGFHPQTKVWRAAGCIAGKVVGISGFMPIQGEMEMDSLWPFAWCLPHTAPEDAQERPPLAGLRRSEHIHLNYFVSLCDQRSVTPFGAFPVGLFEEERGAVAIRHEDGRVFLSGDTGLYGALQAYYDAWRALGRPQMYDYDLKFIPLTEPVPAPTPRAWMLERKYYRQVWTLPEAISTSR